MDEALNGARNTIVSGSHCMQSTRVETHTRLTELLSCWPTAPVTPQEPAALALYHDHSGQCHGA